MSEKIDNRKSGIITGPALKSASSTVLVCGRSGTSEGVADCATKEKIFMPESGYLRRAGAGCNRRTPYRRSRARFCSKKVCPALWSAATCRRFQKRGHVHALQSLKQIDRRRWGGGHGRCGRVEFRDRARCS